MERRPLWRDVLLEACRISDTTPPQEPSRLDTEVELMLCFADIARERATGIHRKCAVAGRNVARLKDLLDTAMHCLRDPDAAHRLLARARTMASLVDVDLATARLFAAGLQRDCGQWRDAALEEPPPMH